MFICFDRGFIDERQNPLSLLGLYSSKKGVSDFFMIANAVETHVRCFMLYIRTFIIGCALAEMTVR